MKKKSCLAIFRKVLTACMLLIVPAADSGAAYANTAAPVEKAMPAANQFIPLQQSANAPARRTVAQKPPLRFFSAPGREPVRRTASSEPPALPMRSASAGAGALTQEQAKLLLSLFEE